MTGYSGTPLIKKLGLLNVSQAYIINPPENYKKLLFEWGVEYITIPQGKHSWIHAFFTDKDALEQEIIKLKTSLVLDGQLWISWPKKTSKIASDLDGNTVTSIGLEAGLVDVKVAAIDENWSGLKFVYRLVDRK